MAPSFLPLFFLLRQDIDTIGTRKGKDYFDQEYRVLEAEREPISTVKVSRVHSRDDVQMYVTMLYCA